MGEAAPRRVGSAPRCPAPLPRALLPAPALAARRDRRIRRDRGDRRGRREGERLGSQEADGRRLGLWAVSTRGPPPRAALPDPTRPRRAARSLDERLQGAGTQGQEPAGDDRGRRPSALLSPRSRSVTLRVSRLGSQLSPRAGPTRGRWRDGAISLSQTRAQRRLPVATASPGASEHSPDADGNPSHRPRPHPVTADWSPPAGARPTPCSSSRQIRSPEPCHKSLSQTRGDAALVGQAGRATAPHRHLSLRRSLTVWTA